MNFLERVQPTVALGVPVIRLRPKSKIAMDLDWPSLATTDLSILQKWNEETPDANAGVVAKAEPGGVFFLEVDSPTVSSRIEQETGQKLPPTFRVRSRPGRGHYYWKQSPASIALGNLDQGSVKNNDFSVRVDTQYVVAANSLHPISGGPYEIVSTSEIVEAPDWLIQWLASQKITKKPSNNLFDGEIIPRGAHDSTLHSIAGKLRYIGMEEEAIYNSLVEICEKRCEDYGSDYLEMCRKHAHNIAKKPTGILDQVLIGGVPAGQTAYGVQPAKPLVELVTPPDIKIIPYPTFPQWVFSGTSLFDGLVKPLCDSNSRHPEFQWMPAMVLLLNYLGGRVRLEFKPYMPSIFMVSIGRRGRLFKSACVRDAFKYFEYGGMLGWGDSQTRNAEGRIVVITPGSGEGLGKEIQRMAAKNFVIFYDELTALTQKASIESSSLVSTLLSVYEGQGLQNAVKTTKDSFSLRDGEYCGSLIACCTDKNFLSNWSKLAGKSTGLDDRFFFLYQPEVFKELIEYKHAYTQEAAIKTRQLIDKAVTQGVYSITDSSPLKKFFKENQDSSRAGIRVEKFALGFAVDLGLDEVDSDCLERSLALIEYEKSVKKYLELYEASTREGAIQMEIIHTLQRSQGRMNNRDLERVLHPERLGSSLWSQSFYGLVKTGWIREEGTGTRGDPKTIVLLRVPEEDE